MKQMEKMQQERTMFTLRLTQSTEGEEKYRVEVALEGGGLPRQTATSHFDFKLTDQDQEEIRWYLEDFLQYPHDPAPKIAARIEGRMAEIGTELFRALFQSSDDARDLWATLRARLNETRIEIVTTVAEATTIPWELIRDPKTDTPLPLRARSFVHAHPQAAQVPKIPEADAGPIRILLAICRPGAGDDVPFRSVASRLVKGLGEDARALFQLDVLRPPTFEQMGRILRRANAEGQPYHIVHFDGHGTHVDEAQSDGMESLLLSAPRPGSHGYLLFENPVLEENMQLVDGTTLGKLLVETGVPVLMLNACRSAYADPLTAPVAAESRDDDPHARVRAIGSLAQEVMDAGAAGVVAMRYNVYVATAAQFVADLYAALTQGYTLGEAVTLCRKQLADNPLREIAFDPRPLQDWSVPVVYEAAPISLFPAPDTPETLTITLSEDQGTPSCGDLDPKLPKIPDAGFFGRDGTLLALDRAFDTQKIVLLHAYAGSGKTATAAEFARWYSLTGGVSGRVLFTSFERYRPLARALDRIGDTFGGALERVGVHWLALSDEERRDVALQVLKQIPVLWIWDNVEPVAGFPAGTESVWSTREQEELVDFLRDAQETKAKFLLTSRRDERTWLGESLPARITVPPMPLQEQVQLARAIAEKHGQRLTGVEDWRPLFKFSQGNPLTITVVIGQALRDGLETRERIEAFVERLRAGEAAFDDEVSEGRSKSLGASLNYGFEHAFGEEELRQLALLHFFQGFVSAIDLEMMGNSEKPWSLPAVRGITLDAWVELLGRAADVGVLSTYNEGYYFVHPALPWFFKSLLKHYYPASASSREDDTEGRACHAFIEAISVSGNITKHLYKSDVSRVVVDLLTHQEANLRYAIHLARICGWWSPVIGLMEGLSVLYGHTGRRAEWAHLVEEIVPDYVDLDTDGPLPGREHKWAFVTGYRAKLAQEAMHWSQAERLQRLVLEWSRQNVTPLLDISPEALDDDQRHAIGELAAAEGYLGDVLCAQGRSECIPFYRTAIGYAKRIGDQSAEATTAFNLGHAYFANHDLVQAERCYHRSLKLHSEHDRLGRGRCLAQLGQVAFLRFQEARDAGRAANELSNLFVAALQVNHKALKLLPSDAVDPVAAVNHQLGNLYGEAGDLDNARSYYRESIRYRESEGNLYAAAFTRRNFAVLLKRADSFTDALEYARAALRNFETYGDRASEEIQRTQSLINEIEHNLESKGDY